MLSIVIPAYNAEKFIFDVLENLISQIVNDVEILVVNDGSTDSTKVIVEKFCKNYSFIKLINQEIKVKVVLEILE